MAKQGKEDLLLKRLAKLDREADQGSERAETALDNPNDNAVQGLKQTLQGLRWLGNFTYNAVSVAKQAWDTVGRPVWNAVSPPFAWGYRQYMDKVWSRFAYKDGDDGERRFAPRKAGLVLAFTAAAAMAVVPTFNLAVEGGIMASTIRDDTVYLHTVVSHGDNTYSVKGCDTLGDCGTEDAVYYNVEKSFARHLYSLFNDGSLHIPKKLVGTVSPDSNNQCDVTIYGTVYEKAMQNFEIYPELLDISCTRVDMNGNPLGDAVTPGDVDVDVQEIVAPVAPAPAAPATVQPGMAPS